MPVNQSEQQDLLKPVIEGIFGKQRKELYHRPVFEERTLPFMLQALSEIPLMDWYRYVFSREPLVGRISEEKQRQWMQEAWECGTSWADRAQQEYGTTVAWELAQKMGMQVRYPELPEKTDRVLFAEFREPNQIRIYMDAIEKAKPSLEDPEVLQILQNTEVTDTLILHELFHSLEELHQKEIFTRTEKLRLWSIGPFHYESSVIALSEIAAMGFAYRFGGMKVSPYLLDVLLVYGYSPQEASGLFEEMMEYAASAQKGMEDENSI